MNSSTRYSLIAAMVILIHCSHLVAETNDDRWASAEREGEWLIMPWFGWFTNPSADWIYHAEHGWWNCMGDTVDSLRVYDGAMEMWGWTSQSAYPWIYWFEPVNAWSYYLIGGEGAARWFYRADTAVWRNAATVMWALPVRTDTIETVLVEGDILLTSNELNRKSVGTFEIGKYEVTWGEWQRVLNYAGAKGYDISGVGAGCTVNHPVQSVNWYDAVKWCNARSEIEGLRPVYWVGGEVYRGGESDAVEVDTSANG